jgi:hypothetical protein
VNRSLRLVAGTLVLALPLVAAAGCGAQKRKSVRQEFTAAQGYLGASKAAAFTLKLSDPQGTLAKLITKDGDTPAALAHAMLNGSITYIADPVGDATLKSVSSGATPTDLKAALNKVNLGFVVRDDKAEIVELRLVAGNLYAHVNLAEIGVLAKAGGVDDFDAQLDEGIAAMGPGFKTGLADVRAGKWLKLPLATYLDQLQDLANGLTPGATPATPKSYDFTGLGEKAYAAVKPYVKVTDANDSSKDRVLDVTVQVKPALKALLSLFKAEKDLPFASFLADADPAEIDKKVSNGSAKGTITLHDSHLTKVALDLESLRLLSTDPGVDSFAGSQVVLEFDDSVSQLSAPTDVSSLDLGALIEELIGSFFGGGFASSYSSSSGLVGG